MRKLPPIKNLFSLKRFRNNQEVYVHAAKKEEVIINNKQIDSKEDDITLTDQIDAIFEDSTFVCKKDVVICLLSGKTLNKTIVGRTSKEIITMSGEKINIKDIKSIK